ncbi:MAG: RNA-binding protein [Firmicutes bacterium]|nr:RNA-binding protein [Bacillota bacterium]
MGLEIGQLVSSKAGRDWRRKYLVVELLDDNFVLVADGKTRKISKPKKKNIKHLVAHPVKAAEIAEAIKAKRKVTNQQIRMNLASLIAMTEKREEGSSNNG